MVQKSSIPLAFLYLEVLCYQEAKLNFRSAAKDRSEDEVIAEFEKSAESIEQGCNFVLFYFITFLNLLFFFFTVIIHVYELISNFKGFFELDCPIKPNKETFLCFAIRNQKFKFAKWLINHNVFSETVFKKLEIYSEKFIVDCLLYRN